MRATLTAKNTTKSWVSHTIIGDIYHDGQAYDNVELAIRIQHFNKEQVNHIYDVVDNYLDTMGTDDNKRAYNALYRLACKLNVTTMDLIEWEAF